MWESQGDAWKRSEKATSARVSNLTPLAAEWSGIPVVEAGDAGMRGGVRAMRWEMRK
jgi:hypothetical protein